jgi:hypothetical protein
MNFCNSTLQQRQHFYFKTHHNVQWEEDENIVEAAKSETQE